MPALISIGTAISLNALIHSLSQRVRQRSFVPSQKGMVISMNEAVCNQLLAMLVAQLKIKQENLEDLQQSVSDICETMERELPKQNKRTSNQRQLSAIADLMATQAELLLSENDRAAFDRFLEYSVTLHRFTMYELAAAQEAIQVSEKSLQHLRDNPPPSRDSTKNEACNPEELKEYKKIVRKVRYDLHQQQELMGWFDEVVKHAKVRSTT